MRGQRSEQRHASTEGSPPIELSVHRIRAGDPAIPSQAATPTATQASTGHLGYVAATEDTSRARRLTPSGHTPRRRRERGYAARAPEFPKETNLDTSRVGK